MSVAMAIFSCAVGSDALLRHWEYFKRQEADRYHVILTEDARCHAPAGVHTIVIGKDCYIDGNHLPLRLLNTIERMLMDPWQELLCLEYDVVLAKRIPVEKVWTVAAHYAGANTWGSKANAFFHCPWIYSREGAIRFLAAGRKALADGICPPRLPHGASTAECSPDVFFGYCCQEANIPVQRDVFLEYSRNDLNDPIHLEEARQAWRSGVHCVHGVKQKFQLDRILSE